MRSLTQALVVSCAIVAGAGFADASLLPLTAGQSATATTDDPQTGSLVISTGTLPFSGFTFSGTLTQEVRQETLAANPLGGLTFIYKVASDVSSTTALHRLSMFNFTGFTIDASYFGPGVAPTDFDRDAFGVVGAALPNLAAGQTTAWIVLRTNAPGYTAGVNALIDGGAAQVLGYAPVPEPASLALLAVGGLTLVKRRRDRRAASSSSC